MKQTKEDLLKILSIRHELTEYQVNCFIPLFEYLSIEKIRKYMRRLFVNFLEGDNLDNLLDRYIKLKSLPSKGVTFEKMILKYGKIIGKKKWDEYREKQAYTNTFEYKNKKYGITPEQFDEYNKNRAVTLENCIQKHGEKEGLKIWNSYIEKQKDAGCSLKYFKEKYGEIEGKKIYEDLNKKKANTLEGFLLRYGEDGILKYNEFVQNIKIGGYFSKSSQQLFYDLEQLLIDKKIDTSGVRYFSKNSEYGKMFKNTFKKYDFVDTVNMVAIEYNGDYWHANPKNYMPTEEFKFRGKKIIAKDIWDADMEKNRLLINSGFHLIIVWESDYKNDPTLTLERIYNELYRDKQF